MLTTLGRLDRLPALDAHVAHRGTVESVGGLLHAAGFSVEETFTSSFHMRFADGSALVRHSFIRLGFVPGLKMVAAPDALHETFTALEGALNRVATARGELRLTVPMACLTARKPTAADHALRRP